MIKKQKDSKINSRDIYKYIDEKKFKKIIKKFCYSYIPELKDKENTFFRNKIDPMLSIFCQGRSQLFELLDTINFCMERCCCISNFLWSKPDHRIRVVRA